MDAPGFYTLGDFSLTTSGTYRPDAGDELTGLDGMESAAVELFFTFGTGGGSPSGKAYLQTSLDQANEGGVSSGSWVDIASVTFAQTSERWIFTFTRAPVGPITPSDGAMTDDTHQNGILGDRLRLKVVSVGTYANSSFGGRVVAA
jgi:hypothetical protein